jgi:hypothetical protein
MDAQKSSMQSVSLPLSEYNQLYEQAYLNERRAELQKERQALEELKKMQEENLRQKEKRIDEAKIRGDKERRGAVTSQNWLLTSQSVEGCYEPAPNSQDGGFAVFDFKVEFRVFEQEWTVIPLVDSQVITDGWAVQRVDSSAIPTGSVAPDPSAWTTVSLSSDALLLVQELDGAPGRQVLATSTAGLYRITFSVYAPVRCARNLNSLSLSLVHPITMAKLRLKHAPQELSITPASQYSLGDVDDFVYINMRLPPTKSLEVRWRGGELTATSVSSDLAEWVDSGAEKVVPDEEPLQITATHDALHSIMDGVLQSSHTLKYCVDSEKGALTSARFTVLGTARVTGVTGHGVVNWRASLAENGTLIDVSFRSSLISDTVILLLSTEMELDTDSLTVPSLICEGVLRQTGSLGIVKIANVEVHEKFAKGMAHVGVEELPSELKCQTNRPIMFAYKYLTPQSNVQLQVIKHEQVGVLEAVAESAFYEVLMSEGQSMHRLMLNMQNSRKQYLEVRGIPADASIWSLLVNSKPAKPVRGFDGILLVPLLVGDCGSSNEGAQSASVEIVYLAQRDSLGASGSMNLAPPSLDVPVSRLLVEVQWPDSYEVKFIASGQAVNHFSQSLPKPVNHDVGTDIVESRFDFNKAPAYIPKAGVNVQVPRAGQRHRFEQLLVVDGGAHLTAEYHTKTAKIEKAEGWLALLLARLCSHRR